MAFVCKTKNTHMRHGVKPCSLYIFGNAGAQENFPVSRIMREGFSPSGGRNEERKKQDESILSLSSFFPFSFFSFILYNSLTQKMPTAFFANDLGNRAIGQSGNRAIGQSGNRAIGQSGNRAIGQSGNRAIGQSGNRAIGQSGNRAIGQSGNRAIIHLFI